eukprot:4560011-Heterocapsa_arctica.AAC.1
MEFVLRERERERERGGEREREIPGVLESGMGISLWAPRPRRSGERGWARTSENCRSSAACRTIV